MVDSVNPISGSISTLPAQPDRSLSISSEPDNKWFADRQSRIDNDLERLRQKGAELEQQDPQSEQEAIGDSDVARDGGARHESHANDRGGEDKLSGESSQIGTVDFDDDTPFGHRTAFV